MPPFSVQVCRNDDCRTANVTWPTAGMGSPSTTFPSAGSADVVSADILANGSAGGTLTVTWDVRGGPVSNGDHYTVKVTDAGTVVASLDAIAMYSRAEINGPSCGTCTSVVLTS
jgi:hypothetical protein